VLVTIIILRNVIYVILSALVSSSEQLEIHNRIVSWDPTVAFPSIPTNCISRYQYSINGANVNNVTDTLFRLDSSFTDTQNCATNVLTIRSIVTVNNSVLNNVVLKGSTCSSRGNNDSVLEYTGTL